MFTTLTSVFFSIPGFSYGLLTIYILAPINITWFTNYLFGCLAVCLRRNKHSVNPCYWIIYFFVQIALWVLAIYAMWGLDVKFDIYLSIAICITNFITLGIQFILDLVLFDLFVAYFYQSVFEDNRKPLKGFLSFIRFRGFYVE
jgi:hypothetical protein